MDVAVALVRVYLHANGYFTVTEYPVVESPRRGEYRVATDLDVLAIRFPGAGRVVSRGKGGERDVVLTSPDPALESSEDRIEMVIGEVKEGRAELNRGARDASVLRSALRRFGGFERGECDRLAQDLLRKGVAEVDGGPRVRLIAFGSWKDPEAHGAFGVITLGHVIRFFEEMAETSWDWLGGTQFKDPMMAMMLLLEKARRLEGKEAGEGGKG